MNEYMVLSYELFLESFYKIKINLGVHDLIFHNVCCHVLLQFDTAY